MCGISGVFSIQPIKAKIIQEMNDLIKHRGPDDEGYFVTLGNEFYVAKGQDTPRFLSEAKATAAYLPTDNLSVEQDVNLALGHRRLSIMDLSVLGHQPMSDRAQRYWIVFNGEVYNYREIRAELESLGHHFLSDSDTEVVICALSLWGIDALNRFVGMWAIALYDSLDHTLQLIRDRFGIKPLYYWVSPSGVLHFASEIKQFSASSEWTATMNTRRALDYLALNGLTDHTDETMFNDVYQVRPGCYINLNLKNWDTKPFSRLKNTQWYNPSVTPYSGTFDDARSEFRTLFMRSVELHLTSDVNVGFALSGGLDSSTILCSAQTLHSSQRQSNAHVTFSAVSEDKEFSEHEWIEKVHRHLTNVDAHFVSPEPNEMFSHFEQLLWHLDEPHQSQSAFFGFKIFESAKKADIKVLLNGQGADEYLSCYGAYRHMFNKTLGLSELVSLQRLNGIGTVKAIRAALKCYLYDFYVKSSGSWRSFLFNRKSTTKQVKRFVAEGIFDNEFSYPFVDVDFSNKNGVSNFQLYQDALPRYLRWEDRNSMAHSVEARVPFLDHRLVEFCHNLPLDLLEDGKTSKRLLVEAMKNVLPEAVRLRKDKKGFITPEQKWFMADFTNELRNMLENAIRYSSGFFTKDSLKDFDLMVAGKAPFSLIFWRVIVLGYWMKVHNVKFDSK